MGHEHKTLLLFNCGIISIIILSLIFCVILVSANAQSPPQTFDRILDSQEDLLKQMQDQLTWLKFGCGGVITALCGAIGILFRCTQKQQSAIVHEVKNSLKVKEEILIRFAEIHKENLENSFQNREVSEKMRAAILPLVDAINKLPCVNPILEDMLPTTPSMINCPAR
jgi:hypothetical protein